MTNIKNIFHRLVARKSVAQLKLEADQQNQLKRTLNLFQVLALGIGSIIGSGIFVLSGEVAAKYTGPAVIVSFIVAAIVAQLAALSYSEIASMMPVAGSIYSYTYAVLGEYPAWIIGWNLVLEYLLAAATVAVGWSGYFVYFLRSVLQVQLPTSITHAPLTWNEQTEHFQGTGHILNLPALCIILLLTILLLKTINGSAILNLIFVTIKLMVIFLFIFSCCIYIRPENFHPFFPENQGSFKKYGVSGMLHGSTIVFFAYIGFDTVTTVAQEVKNPEKVLPISIIGSLTISSILYIAVCTVMVGIVPFSKLNSNNPLSSAIGGTPYGIWLPTLIDLGIVAGLTSVSLTNLLGQSRLLYSMSNDGLLPKIFSKISSENRIPQISTIFGGISCALFAGFLPLDVLSRMTSIGTLFAFLLVHTAVIIVRSKQEKSSRNFRLPFGRWLIPSVGILFSLLLIILSSKETFIRLFIWTTIGQFIYLFYGYFNSKLELNQTNQNETIDENLQHQFNLDEQQI